MFFSQKRLTNELKIDIVIVVPMGKHSGGVEYGCLLFSFNSSNQTSN